MLVAASSKARHSNLQAVLVEADALQFPVADETFDAVAISFGFRNLANYQAGLTELRRILRPGGTLAVLEFSHPPGVLMKTAYAFYSKILLPGIGGLISGSREAYAYLPDSIRKFPDAPLLQQMMEHAGFLNTRYELLTGGIAALHIGFRPLGIIAG
jgi:demethylmenaquinone methyltransferase/2-methoxy-6-polyprenyl-1,4-benzoquinol methylase